MVSKLLHILGRGVLGFPEGSTRLLLGSGGPSVASLAWALVGFSRLLWHHYQLLVLDPEYYLQVPALCFSVGLLLALMTRELPLMSLTLLCVSDCRLELGDSRG